MKIPNLVQYSTSEGLENFISDAFYDRRGIAVHVALLGNHCIF